MSKRNLIILLVFAIAVIINYSGNITDIVMIVKDRIAHQEEVKRELSPETKIKRSVSPHKRYKIEWIEMYADAEKVATFELTDIKINTRKILKLDSSMWNIDSILWSPDERHFVVNSSIGAYYGKSDLFTVSGKAIESYIDVSDNLPEWDYGANWHMGDATRKWLDNDRISWTRFRGVNYLDGYSSIGSHKMAWYIYSIKGKRSKLVNLEEEISICKALQPKTVKQLSQYLVSLNKEACLKRIDNAQYNIIAKVSVVQPEMDRIIKILGGKINKSGSINDFDDWVKAAKEAKAKNKAVEFLRCADFIVKARSLSAESYVLRGDAEVMLGYGISAYSDYKRAMELAPSDVNVAIKWCEFRVNFQKDPRAINDLNAAMARFPKSPQLYILRSQTYPAGDERAFKDIEKAIEYSKDNKEKYFIFKIYMLLSDNSLDQDKKAAKLSRYLMKKYPKNERIGYLKTYMKDLYDPQVTRYVILGELLRIYNEM